MKKKQAWRYYCDHCGKGSGSASHTKRHESSCCRNPKRECRMCQVLQRPIEDLIAALAKGTPEDVVLQRPIEDLIAALAKGTPEDVNNLRDAASGCPACMLAAIIQSKLQRPFISEEDSGFHVDFNFKDEKERFWQGVTSRDMTEHPRNYI